jgi:hypothetical protein
MWGSIRWNIIVGLVAMILTFIFSLTNNLLVTSLVRSFYSFAVIFAMMFFLRWLLGTVAGFDSLTSDKGSNDNLGKHVDFSTPDEEQALNDLIKKQTSSKEGAAEFSPLNPPQLKSMDKLDPEQLAKAIRFLSED